MARSNNSRQYNGAATSAAMSSTPGFDALAGAALTDQLVSGLERLSQALDRANFGAATTSDASSVGQGEASLATTLPGSAEPSSSNPMPAGEPAAAAHDDVQREIRDALLRMADDGVTIANPEALRSPPTFA